MPKKGNIDIEENRHSPQVQTPL